MCLSKTPYKIYLNSADGTVRNPESGLKIDSVLHKRYAFNWSSFMQDLDDVKYFHLKVESFCLYVPQGLDIPSIEIHCPQIESPFYHSSNQEKPIAIVQEKQIHDVDTDPNTESLQAVSYHFDSSHSDGQVVCIKKDAFLDIQLKHMEIDPNLSATAIHGKSVDTSINYRDSLGNLVSSGIPNYVLVLSLSPIKE
jgi:hypothetical protein